MWNCFITECSGTLFILVVYHLLENSGNFGWNVNGKRFLGSSNWKTPEMYGSSEKVVLFSRLERFESISLFHLHVPVGMINTTKNREANSAVIFDLRTKLHQQIQLHKNSGYSRWMKLRRPNISRFINIGLLPVIYPIRCLHVMHYQFSVKEIDSRKH